jgi:hypothetical protein
LSVTSNGYLFMIHFMNVHQQSSTWTWFLCKRFLSVGDV